ncbi:hypothetical protein [Nocardiopsis deserti]|uniref:hypothetical protein n=1 Tax=Nocardiopsis deserti TaxID=2605988 RepID=UPI0012385C8F|nr:hypothetical protein [Nocardiopsis deserti]
MGEPFALPGLSGAANAEVARLELQRPELYPGRVREAFDFWERFVRNPYRRLWDHGQEEGCGAPSCRNHLWETRDLLDAVAYRMTPHRARELRALLRELDDLY